MKKMYQHIFLWIVLILPYGGAYFIYLWYQAQLKQVENATVIIISKDDMQLRAFTYKGKELLRVPIATGLHPGDKQKKGDMKTPEGVFAVSDIQNSSGWKHNFNDGNGEVEGAYGPYFIRLNTPGHQGIGIHGTHDPESLGKRVTEGCIRVKNESLKELVSLISFGTIVIITPGTEDVEI